MRTIKLTIEYDGTGFAGWQRQPGKRTVQESLETVLSRLTKEQVHLVSASRTDAGVHALGQVAHFRTCSQIPTIKLLGALNGLLPRDVSILEVAEAPPGFHAGKQARRKSYRYRIWNSKIRSALGRDRFWHVWANLDIGAMKKGGRCLVGRHDFSAFRGAQSDTKTSVRRVDRIKVGKNKEMIEIQITGNGFLKYMVRNIVGTLVEVGQGKRRPEEVLQILKSKDRKKAGITAPASGLYLVSVQF